MVGEFSGLWTLVELNLFSVGRLLQKIVIINYYSSWFTIYLYKIIQWYTWVCIYTYSVHNFLFFLQTDNLKNNYLRCRLTSREGIVALGVRGCVCVSAEKQLHAVGGEGNALYPVLSSFYCATLYVDVCNCV